MNKFYINMHITWCFIVMTDCSLQCDYILLLNGNLYTVMLWLAVTNNAQVGHLHWLDIYQRVQYKLGVTIYRCLQNRAPQYLVDCCVRTSDVSSRQHLRSANRHQLVVPRHHRSKFGCRSFCVAAPMVWNSFPDSLRDTTLSIDNFRSTLKTHLFTVQGDT